MSNDFEQDINAFTLKLPNMCEKIIRGTLFDLSSAIIKGTPVDTGRLRGNWMASNAVPDTSSTTKTDKTGNSTINRLDAVIKSFKLGIKFYLTNNLPYAKKIEYGGSQKAPQGMVRINIARVQRMINNNSRKQKL